MTHPRSRGAAGPRLPPLYELEAREAVDSVALEAQRLAEAGADEGTVVWARRQTAATDRAGRTREAPAGNLYCAVLLRPEFSLEVGAELGYVAVLGLGSALAGVIEPMTSLRYGWPNALLLNAARAGSIFLHAGPLAAGIPAWLTVGLEVNVRRFPADPELHSTSLDAEGSAGVRVEDLLESFSRQFLVWLNRWSADGFGDIRKRWLQGAEGVGGPLSLRLGDVAVAGTLETVDEAGRAVVSLASGETRRVSLVEYFALGGG